MTYITSLISGVGIFCFGTGLSFYHGFMGLYDPHPVESLNWVINTSIPDIGLANKHLAFKGFIFATRFSF
jgi:hypothetical protein